MTDTITAIGEAQLARIIRPAHIDADIWARLICERVLPIHPDPADGVLVVAGDLDTFDVIEQLGLGTVTVIDSFAGDRGGVRFESVEQLAKQRAFDALFRSLAARGERVSSITMDSAGRTALGASSITVTATVAGQ